MKNIYLLFTSIIVVILFLASSSSHPTDPNGGFTGAPLDGVCTQCHGSVNNNLSGSFEIIGIPEVAIRGIVYPIGITVTNPEMDASRAGFQLLAIEADLSNAGTLEPLGDKIIRKQAKGRTYIGHSPAVNFDDLNRADWSGQWTADSTDEGTISFYGVGMIGNGKDGNRGDRPIFRKWETEVKDSTEAVVVDLNIIQELSCNEDSTGILNANIIGGIGMKEIIWNTGETTSQIKVSFAGNYSVSVTDGIGNIDSAKIEIDLPDSLKIDSVIIKDLTSSSSEDGEINLEISGGKQPYSIYWISETSSDTIGTELGLSGLRSGNYEVVIEDMSKCYKITARYEIGFTSSYNEISDQEFTIYPIPSNGNIYFNTEIDINKYHLFNLQGQKLLTENITNKKEVEINQPPGIYLLVLENKEIRFARKIIINQ